MLQPAPGSDVPNLLTRSPGYRLVVDPESVDLHRFQRLAEAGNRRLRAGSPEAAAVALRNALSLWRGPALADLAEAGIVWPELGNLHNARMDALEDYFDADISCGRYQGVINELGNDLDGIALRERSCRLLMLALYRCGRQADALNVYARARTMLAEELGLEPGRELQLLQQAILNQSPELNLDDTNQLATHGLLSVPPGQVIEVHRRADPEPMGVRRRAAAFDGPAALASPARASAIVEEPPEPLRSERRKVSVMLIRSHIDTGTTRLDVAALDRLLEGASQWIRETVERFGGSVSTTIGSVTVGLFDADGARGDDAERAVLATMAIRNRWHPVETPAAGDVPPNGHRVSFRATVVTGEALMPNRPDGPAGICGTLLDRSQAMLLRTGECEIRVCATTRTDTASIIDCQPTADPGEWRVRGFRPTSIGLDTIPTVERGFELDLLGGLLDRARHRRTPHFVTALGEPGSGKTRYLAELERMFGHRVHLAHVCADPAELPGRDGVFAVQAALVRALCEIRPTDAPERAMERLTRTVRRLADSDEHADRVLRCITPFVADEPVPGLAVDVREDLARWGNFLEGTPLDRPVLLLIDDLHRSDDDLLLMVDGLADFIGVPLLVVAAATPELLQRRPDWGRGKQNFTTITLEALSDAAIDELVDFVHSSSPLQPRESTHWFRRALSVIKGDRPDELRGYVRSLLATRSARHFLSGYPSGARSM
ncbi:BTAD domain-containing putative transcriptional regulator [Micromonospora humidisoli]|uniref:BTAD domain-containing putative transcriptional regulator n=1 Tax=Micromonospora sp. AKA109 TaxID=2733865 RepID=UPI0024935A77|nr:BTAD domain-containing putative transcriptional regulator [Micromonospora sp. AKA109]